MTVEIRPCVLRGTLCAPPSKSIAHRMLLSSALAEGTSILHGISDSEDIRASLACARSLGTEITQNGDTAVICVGKSGSTAPFFPCGESGSTLRFFLPAALTRYSGAVFSGSKRLMERGISVYEAALGEKGVRFNKGNDCITAEGKLLSGAYTLRGDVSSQFISGLFFALPLLDGDSTLCVTPPVESRPYLDLTLDILYRFGIRITETERNRFLIPGNQRYHAMEGTVEGDWSNAAALYAFRFSGGDVTVTGLREDSVQGDRVCTALFQRLRETSPVLDLSDCPDLGPVLFAAAALCRGAHFTGLRRLRLKESDRVSAMAEELAKFGITMKVGENAADVLSGPLHRPTEPLNGHNDHRIVMALAVPASAVGGEITGAVAVRKSYPGYFDALRSLGADIREKQD